MQVIPPQKIVEHEFDYIIISRAIYEKEIIRYLVEELNIASNKIITFMPNSGEVIWEEERVVRLRKCIAMLKERNIGGNMAEVGVYRGDFAKLMNRYLPDKKLYLFDTFEGFDATRDVVQQADLNGFKDTSIELVLSKMVTPQNCIVRKGYFPDTTAGLDDTFCLVSLDCDLYKPILNGLNYFWSRLVSGGYIFVHDFGSYHFTEVKEAVYEFLKMTSAAIVPVSDICESVIIAK